MLTIIFNNFDFMLSFLPAIIIGVYLYTTWYYDYWSKLGVKCPWSPVPLFGHVFQSITLKKHFMEVLEDIYRKIDDEPFVGIYSMRTPEFFIKDPEIIGKVLIKDFNYFTDRGSLNNPKNPLSHNIFQTGGERWRTMRQKLSPTFTTNKLKYMIEQIKICSDSLLECINENFIKYSGQMEIRDMMGKYSTDVIGKCAFGLDLDTINDPESEFRNYGKVTFQPSIRAHVIVSVFLTQPSLLRFMPSSFQPQKSIDFFRNAFQQTIHHRIESKIERKDVVQQLMKAREDLVLNPALNDKDKFSEMDIVANAYILFVAGFETVSTSMSFCLYELALHKNIQDKVREEIIGIKSKNDGKLDNDCLCDLQYLNMVIKETLRRYPPLVFLTRVVTKPYTLPDTNITLENGTKILIPVRSLHYDCKYFPNPNEFDPERFSDENINKLHPNTYMPFGDGPRQCIAKRFAEIEMKLALSEILSKYEVLPCEKTQIPIKYIIGSFVNAPENIWLKFKPIHS
ncbi:probable cytochrome P450 6a13 isoform X3 [Daktulosphaira vitifoliae]|uniref:probable cytochrome P450 6a13 isoform X1 n=1 Tax=Daktulosphaira vitifoliae TaxID=58002 RepID=UPI0021A9C94F|nr:probable cytochrome P450 6a13 isoform X1 [Daktulosphaira vitifoliae]XP_050539635.1 probable cytochrome P450 6a13 isoform X2 [Daktulosphaira vitifoliae]XP_050539636.1 probable cytochrome P450 6a13 isoform X3 [Daktulosphaira vitifoliae]